MSANFISTTKAAKFLGLSSTTVGKMVRENRLKGMIIPGEKKDTIRVDADAIGYSEEGGADELAS